MKALKRHPFPTVAWFQRVVAVSFAFPEGLLRSLAPAPLELDTYEGFGFVTISMVWAKNLRPAGFPAFCGQDFFLAGYRVFTKLTDPTGRRLRGLKILRSEADKSLMVFLGNLLTHYRYRKVTAKFDGVTRGNRVQTFLPDGRLTLDLTFDSSSQSAALPPGSPFPDWKTARRFAGPMPFTFDSEGDGRFVVIEGSRQEWSPRPIEVKEWSSALFDEAPFAGTKPILANAFLVENVPYHWSRGRLITPGVRP